MIKASELREKEIVNVVDGSKLGLISDIEIDLAEAKIKAIIMPKPGGIMSFFSKSNNIIIEWKDIVRIGREVILVNINSEEYKDFIDNDQRR
ncbi:YlmC/YmxH family sporulation protein [Clostridium sp. D2Q-11]|uniref:YlmC/YmxH family sporulation protein n=1 Tax=Anaeromonas frigoriresistens TaxID=2683708 RepID=A0A942V1C6_9FIRM|nr:YlmC/YmxH family sporulation protein [Anaeromonas frigoriresistens]MBS4540076.1 YlmC/YmxH family sporulation protein [Anaeromonas frigoriresistens]